MEEIMNNLDWETFDQFRQINADFLVFGHKFREFFPQMGSSQQMKSSLQTLDFDPVQPNGMTLSGDQSIHDQALIQQEGVEYSDCNEGEGSYDPMPELSSRDITSSMLMNVLALVSRRLITTEGGWLGLAPEEVQKGDVVANLY
jgi:hypothetical protein